MKQTIKIVSIVLLVLGASFLMFGCEERTEIFQKYNRLVKKKIRQNKHKDFIRRLFSQKKYKQLFSKDEFKKAKKEFQELINLPPEKFREKKKQLLKKYNQLLKKRIKEKKHKYKEDKKKLKNKEAGAK